MDFEDAGRVELELVALAETSDKRCLHEDDGRLGKSPDTRVGVLVYVCRLTLLELLRKKVLPTATGPC